MRPDDRSSAFDELIDSGMDLPFDADLESLDRELGAAGQHARHVLHGRTQPTRLFSNQLRAHLLGAVATGSGTADATGGSPAAASITQRDAAVTAPPNGSERERQRARPALTVRPAANERATEQTAATEWPGAAEARPTRLPFVLPVRTVLAFLAIAGMAGVLALGALVGNFGPPLP